MKKEEKSIAKIPLTLVTENKNKLKEFQMLVDDIILLDSENYALPELQGECIDIAKAKVKIAYEKFQKPILTEDTSLCFNALGGLPGPYIKWFLQKLGHEGLNKLLAGYQDKTAIAQCILGYMSENEKEPRLFIGQTKGAIVMPRGPKLFGWDPIFEVDGYNLTYAEMGQEMKNTLSHRFKAIKLMKDFFKDTSNFPVQKIKKQ